MGGAGAPRKKILLVEDDPDLSQAICGLLETSGYTVSTVTDGVKALDQIDRRVYDLMLLDVGLPHADGMQVLSSLRERRAAPRVIVMTADNAPETMLRAVREQAYDYISKPAPPGMLTEAVARALDAPRTTLPIEVISATPNWVELLVPCDRAAAERIQTFLFRLKGDLPEAVRESVGLAFRELLLNAMEWGGKLDPLRQVRISYLRSRRMLMYRIADPGEGFRFEGLTHAAVNNPETSPVEHTAERERKGLRPGGFGLLLVRSLVDELIYNEAQNEVVFLKYLD
jgi:CheY-like chemotaxis protein/anti-sigma regulatory factor (Ser/Thr protein kinase)